MNKQDKPIKKLTVVIPSEFFLQLKKFDLLIKDDPLIKQLAAANPKAVKIPSKVRSIMIRELINFYVHNESGRLIQK